MDEAAKKRVHKLTLWVLLPVNVAILYSLFFTDIVPLLGAVLIGAIVIFKFIVIYRITA